MFIEIQAELTLEPEALPPLAVRVGQHYWAEDAGAAGRNIVLPTGEKVLVPYSSGKRDANGKAIPNYTPSEENPDFDPAWERWYQQPPQTYLETYYYEGEKLIRSTEALRALAQDQGFALYTNEGPALLRSTPRRPQTELQLLYTNLSGKQYLFLEIEGKPVAVYDPFELPLNPTPEYDTLTQRARHLADGRVYLEDINTLELTEVVPETLGELNSAPPLEDGSHKLADGGVLEVLEGKRVPQLPNEATEASNNLWQQVLAALLCLGLLLSAFWIWRLWKKKQGTGASVEPKGDVLEFDFSPEEKGREDEKAVSDNPTEKSNPYDLVGTETWTKEQLRNQVQGLTNRLDRLDTKLDKAFSKRDQRIQQLRVELEALQGPKEESGNQGEEQVTTTTPGEEAIIKEAAPLDPHALEASEASRLFTAPELDEEEVHWESAASQEATPEEIAVYKALLEVLQSMWAFKSDALAMARGEGIELDDLGFTALKAAVEKALGELYDEEQFALDALWQEALTLLGQGHPLQSGRVADLLVIEPNSAQDAAAIQRRVFQKVIEHYLSPLRVLREELVQLPRITGLGTDAIRQAVALGEKGQAWETALTQAFPVRLYHIALFAPVAASEASNQEYRSCSPLYQIPFEKAFQPETPGPWVREVVAYGYQYGATSPNPTIIITNDGSIQRLV